MQTAVLESERRRATRILTILRKELPIREKDFAASRVAKESGDPFRVLVVTVLSQNCTDVAALRAYDILDERIGVEVTALSRARVRSIENAIRVAGLYKHKAKALKQLAKLVADRYRRDLMPVVKGSFEQARSSLQDLPNVGPKTADVLLSIWGQPTISVDTHVDRVSKRLGFAPNKAKYEEIRSLLMRAFPEKEYRSVPMYLMALGRRVCKAQRPLCPTCPVNKLCRYGRKTKQGPIQEVFP